MFSSLKVKRALPEVLADGAHCLVYCLAHDVGQAARPARVAVLAWLLVQSYVVAHLAIVPVVADYRLHGDTHHLIVLGDQFLDMSPGGHFVLVLQLAVVLLGFIRTVREQFSLDVALNDDID